MGEIAEVSGLSKIAVPERDGQPIEVDDAFVAVVQFANGAIGTMEGSRIAAGYGTTGRLQVDGTKGSVRFELERLNEIEVADGLDSGFRTIRVIKSEHPFSDFWWEASMQGSHPIGWVDCFVHQMHHCLNALTDEGRGRAARRDVRGRLPRGRGLRRRRPFVAVAAPRERELPIARRLIQHRSAVLRRRHGRTPS